jgi:NADH-quinone oxidoreductase subunit G
MREIDTDAQINIVDRGYGSEIATFQEEGVHSLLSGNLMDVCPVGAITTRDYRFKSRPWDNAEVADTICTLCEKGCNTTAWVKAKPEWAKGARLVRFTPRFNPDVNGYWMCDIGRFQYHWIEGDNRLRRPLELRETGTPNAAVQEPVAWHEALSKLRDRLSIAAAANVEGVRFLVSAHASHEELFLFRRLTELLMGADGPRAIHVTWRYSVKEQRERSKFQVPPVDAPNVNGARLFGLAPGQIGAPTSQADLSSLKADVDSGRVSALYVFDPGPDGSLGDTSWIVEARRNGKVPLLIVHGVLHTALSRMADVALPGASYVEKEASYTNGQGRLQGTARVVPLPGDAMEDWQILVNVAVALGVELRYTSAAHVRADIAERFGRVPGFEGITTLAFGRPIPARNWLQASNPSERWKWDFMFQDLPPVKGTVDPLAVPASPLPAGTIELKQVK